MSLKKKKRGKSSKDYIDNEKFTNKIILWVEGLTEIDKQCNKKFNIPEDIVLDLYKIGNHLLSSHNFFNYPEDVKEDMLQFGLLKCIKYATSFDKKKFEEKGLKPNAFTYFTTIMYHQYSDYIRKYYKHKNIAEDIKSEATNILNIYKNTEYINKLIVR